MKPELIKKRRALEYAEKLAKFARISPDVETKNAVYTAVNMVRTRYGFSEAEKKELILEAIENGAMTQEDVCEETLLPQQVVSEILQNLKSEGRVKSQKISLTWVGRPSQIWKLIK